MIIAANWKMNLSRQQAEHHLQHSASHPAHRQPHHQTILFLPACYLPLAETIIGVEHEIAFGGQDCHAESHGAFTGDISAEMITGFGGRWALAGHSERRQYHAEDNHHIARKMVQGLSSGLKMMLCVGENETQRQQGQHFEIVALQLRTVCEALADAGLRLENIAVAYEPVWAIGTGKVAHLEQINEMHEHIQQTVRTNAGDSDHTCHKLPVLYGGSVNAQNAAEIFALDNVDGALVGGASLDAEKFAQLCLIAGQNQPC